MASDKKIQGTGADELLNGTFAADAIYGAAGDDVLNGLNGDDLLVGGTGGDELDGGRGDDVLTGGHGADLFVFSFGDLISSLPPPEMTEVQINLFLGHDVVTDFELGVDHLQVRSGSNPVVLGAADLAPYVLLTETDVDADGALDTVITIDYVDATYGWHVTDPTTSITLLGVTGATVDALFLG